MRVSRRTSSRGRRSLPAVSLLFFYYFLFDTPRTTRGFSMLQQVVVLSTPDPGQLLQPLQQVFHDTTTITTSTATTSNWISSSFTNTNDNSNNDAILGVMDAISQGYKEALKKDPLQTQIITGVGLAVVGDALAQKMQQKNKNKPYDTKRALAFATFDGCYRVLQHYLYPPMIALCQGNFLFGPTKFWLSSVDTAQKLAAAMEQSLVSQLLIIPLLYYPVFFSVTGFVQGLSWSETKHRAQTTFLSLMQRNWLFWIPVQFAVFGFCPQPDWQISILIVCGFLWTVILSFAAGTVVNHDDDDSTTNGIVQEIFPEDEMTTASSEPPPVAPVLVSSFSSEYDHKYDDNLVNSAQPSKLQTNSTTGVRNYY